MVFSLAAGAQSLPDTGQDMCFDGAGMVACAAGNAGDGSSYPRQDGRYGRDPAHAQGVFTKSGGGEAGFDYTKIGVAGAPLATQNAAWASIGSYDVGNEAAGTKWSCVRDNITGLIWEVKTYDATPGLRHRSNTYTWYGADGATNGGNSGGAGGNTCNGTLSGYANQCNTQNYVAAVNASNLCGASDWRLPSYRELLTLVHGGHANPAIESGFFPNTENGAYWTSSTTAWSTGSALQVHFSNGSASSMTKSGTPLLVRLVRGGPF